MTDDKMKLFEKLGGEKKRFITSQMWKEDAEDDVISINLKKKKKYLREEIYYR